METAVYQNHATQQQPVPIGAIMGPGSKPSSHQTYNAPSTRSTAEPERRLQLQHRHLVPTTETVDSILGTDQGQIAAILGGYQKVRGKTGWDEYAGKFDDHVRDALSAKLAELRRHGYFNPVAHDGKIHCRRVVHPNERKMQGESLTLCGLCERDCNRKDVRGVFLVGENKREVKKCWEEAWT